MAPLLGLVTRILPCFIPLAALAPSSFSQSALHVFNGDSGGSQFGSSVNCAGDVNRDGFADLIVGSPLDKAKDRGSARVYSGSDGSILYTFLGDSPHDRFGNSVSGAGDVNGDGFADLIVGAKQDGDPWSNAGSARVLSGVDGSVLYTLKGGSECDYLGWSVSGAGDVNADGFADLIVGVPFDDHLGHAMGSARVFSGRNLLGTNYCSATDNSSGFPALIRAVGSDSVVDNDLTLETVDVAPNQFGYYLMSRKEDFVLGFGGSQGNLCLGAPIQRLAKYARFSGAEGVISLKLDLTSLPQGTIVQPGETWNFQLWFRDVNPNFASNTSNGLALTMK